MENHGKILIIEDSTRWQGIFQDLLEDEGYFVQIAANYADAMNKLDRQAFHVAIVDIRLSETDETNVEGMRVLEKIVERNDGTSTIIVSGYGTLELSREAFKKYSAFDFLEKDTFEPREFLAIVHRGFERALKEIPRPKVTLKELFKGLTIRDIEIKLPAFGHVAKRQSLLERMFRDLFPLHLVYQGGAKLIRTHTGVFMIQASYWSRGLGKLINVRIGERRLVKAESRNFNRYIQGLVTDNTYTEKAAPPFYTSNLGGLLYILHGAPFEKIRDYGTYYKEEDPDKVVRVLENLFTQTCKALYEIQGIKEAHVNLTKMYAKLIQAMKRRREESERRELLEEQKYLAQMEEPDKDAYFEERKMQRDQEEREKLQLGFPEIDGKPLDPLNFVAGQSFDFHTSVSVIHGDLSAGNILVDSRNQTWLVGFYRTGVANVLREFVRLETSVKFELLDTENLQALCEFEEALLSPSQLGDIPRYANSYGIPDLAKAFVVVTRLRELAYEVAQPSDGNMREYLVELLYQTLILYDQLPDGKSREYALTSAAMICGKL